MISFTFHNGFGSIGIIFNFVAKMEKLPQISKASKSNVILSKQEGYKNVEISKRLKLSEASVSRILQRNKQNLSLSPLKRSGRPRTTTPRTDRKIKQLCQKQPFISSSEIKRSMQELISVTTRTIRNRMHKDFKLPARKPLKKPLITPRMAQQRLEFCCHYKDWTKEDWHKVMFSDQSTFLQFASYKPFVRRPHGSLPVDSRYLQPTVKHPPSVMVWGCFSSQGRGGLYFLPKGQTMNASRYISVLDDHLLNFLSIHGCTTFQHDSAPCHETKSVMNWFHTKNVTMLKWAGNSPHLNPIENLRTLIKKKVSTSNPTTLDELKQIVNEIWCTDVDQNVCKNLTDSMPSRI